MVSQLCERKCRSRYQMHNRTNSSLNVNAARAQYRYSARYTANRRKLDIRPIITHDDSQLLHLLSQHPVQLAGD